MPDLKIHTHIDYIAPENLEVDDSGGFDYVTAKNNDRAIFDTQEFPDEVKSAYDRAVKEINQEVTRPVGDEEASYYRGNDDILDKTNNYFTLLSSYSINQNAESETKATTIYSLFYVKKSEASEAGITSLNDFRTACIIACINASSGRIFDVNPSKQQESLNQLSNLTYKGTDNSLELEEPAEIETPDLIPVKWDSIEVPVNPYEPQEIESSEPILKPIELDLTSDENIGTTTIESPVEPVISAPTTASVFEEEVVVEPPENSSTIVLHNDSENEIEESRARSFAKEVLISLGIIIAGTPVLSTIAFLSNKAFDALKNLASAPKENQTTPEDINASTQISENQTSSPEPANEGIRPNPALETNTAQTPSYPQSGGDEPFITATSDSTPLNEQTATNFPQARTGFEDWINPDASSQEITSMVDSLREAEALLENNDVYQTALDYGGMGQDDLSIESAKDWFVRTGGADASELQLYANGANTDAELIAKAENQIQQLAGEYHEKAQAIISDDLNATIEKSQRAGNYYTTLDENADGYRNGADSIKDVFGDLADKLEGKQASSGIIDNPRYANANAAGDKLYFDPELQTTDYSSKTVNEIILDKAGNAFENIKETVGQIWDNTGGRLSSDQWQTVGNGAAVAGLTISAFCTMKAANKLSKQTETTLTERVNFAGSAARTTLMGVGLANPVAMAAAGVVGGATKVWSLAQADTQQQLVDNKAALFAKKEAVAEMSGSNPVSFLHKTVAVASNVAKRGINNAQLAASNPLNNARETTETVYTQSTETISQGVMAMEGFGPEDGILVKKAQGFIQSVTNNTNTAYERLGNFFKQNELAVANSQESYAMV